CLVGRGPIAKALGQLARANRRDLIGQSTRGVTGANDAVESGGSDSRSEPRYPSIEHALPRRFFQRFIEERDPVADAIRFPQRFLPVSFRDARRWRGMRFEPLT